MIGREEESPTRQAWLDGLQKGDPVVIRFARGIEFEYYKSTVDLTTSIEEDGCRRIYADGNVFYRDGRWFQSHLLVEPSPEALNEAERTKLLERMGMLNWKRLPVVVLAQIVALATSSSWEAEKEAEAKLRNVDENNSSIL